MYFTNLINFETKINRYLVIFLLIKLIIKKSIFNIQIDIRPHLNKQNFLIRLAFEDVFTFYNCKLLVYTCKLLSIRKWFFITLYVCKVSYSFILVLIFK